MRAGTRLGNRVVSTGVEGVAAQQPPARKHGSPDCSVPRDGLEGVRAARRVEPTAGRQRRAYPTTVRDDSSCQHSGTECRRAGQAGIRDHVRRLGRRCGPLAAASAASRSAPSRAYDRSAAPGSARTTSRLPGGRSPSRSRTRCRSRRRTALRTTAPPTARDTTNPARAGGGCVSAPVRAGFVIIASSWVSAESRCTTMTPRVARRPERTAAPKSILRRSRCAAGSTDGYRSGDPPGLRPTGGCGPWSGGWRRWPDRPGCACAAGNRGSSRAGGCSAGTCACSRQALRLRTPRPGGPPEWWRGLAAAARTTASDAARWVRTRTAGIRHPIRGRRMSRTSVRRSANGVNHRHGGSAVPTAPDH
jgi:hypothetical protein